MNFNSFSNHSVIDSSTVAECDLPPGLQLPAEELDYAERFAISGDDSILEEVDFGIVNGRITTNVLYSKVLSFRTLFAPPFVSSDFNLDGRIFGEPIMTRAYEWRPTEVRRSGYVRGVEVTSTMTLVQGMRALMLEIQLCNTNDATLDVPVQFEVRGGLDYATSWKFIRPDGRKACRNVVDGDLLIRKNDTGAVVLGLSNLQWEEYSSFLRTSVSVGAGLTKSVWLVVGIGEEEAASNEVRQLLANAEEEIARSNQRQREEFTRIFQQIPRFSASDERLEKFYYRSALHLFLNRWTVDEFVLNPFYSTGSINGGCICSYLWDYSEGAEIFPLADPAASREHIKSFLKINLTRHFSFNPMDGAGWGPWYYINQEKIVSLISNYVLLTGDNGFLHEEVAGKRIVDWVIYHALFGDELNEQANLIDYGSGNHHLELRREYRYDHFMPDLNARRYGTYLTADVLVHIAGGESVDLISRAKKLKELVRREFWDENEQWWSFKDPTGRSEFRYTMQMFKVIGSGVLDEEEELMIGRLNEEEFLSEYGFHSISKKDPAYDQVDIDNGGGGACCCFPPQIAERLYKAGYAVEAEDILSRILWWGERLPYWSDSLVANAIDYRKDTPLQNAVGAVAGAQAIIFGMFGIKIAPDGKITIKPTPPAFSPSISLRGLRLRGQLIDIEVARDRFSVKAGDVVYEESVGQAVTL